jgi:hypothetical protein
MSKSGWIRDDDQQIEIDIDDITGWKTVSGNDMLVDLITKKGTVRVIFGADKVTHYLKGLRDINAR